MNSCSEIALSVACIWNLSTCTSLLHTPLGVVLQAAPQCNRLETAVFHGPIGLLPLSEYGSKHWLPNAIGPMNALKKSLIISGTLLGVAWLATAIYLQLFGCADPNTYSVVPLGHSDLDRTGIALSLAGNCAATWAVNQWGESGLRYFFAIPGAVIGLVWLGLKLGDGEP